MIVPLVVAVNTSAAQGVEVGPAPVNFGFAAVGAPACASSANGTGHMICVIRDGNNNLYAVSALARPGQFAAVPLDPPTRNPLALGVQGVVGQGNCAATADVTSDIVCAYVATSGAAAGALMGIRVSIKTGKIYGPQNLGFAQLGVLSDISCTNGNQRFSVVIAPNQTIASEGPAGATICGFQLGVAPEALVVAFNPVTGYLQTQELGGSTSPPSCANANDGTNQIICVANDDGTLYSVAVDPRTSPQYRSVAQTPFPNVRFGINESAACDSPNDGSGELLCAIIDSDTLEGFATNPREGTGSSMTTLVTNVDNISFPVGTPSCAGFGNNTHEIICGFQLFLDVVPGFFPPFTLTDAIRFNPSTGTSSEIDQGGVENASGASCTFQNRNPAQISCGVVSGTFNGQIFNP